jgi:hypothetical protein
MQKQTHKQSALIDDERLYIDIAPDLIKHAQDMRKQSAEGDTTTMSPNVGGYLDRQDAQMAKLENIGKKPYSIQQGHAPGPYGMEQHQGGRVLGVADEMAANKARRAATREQESAASLAQQDERMIEGGWHRRTDGKPGWTKDPARASTLPSDAINPYATTSQTAKTPAAKPPAAPAAKAPAAATPVAKTPAAPAAKAPAAKTPAAVTPVAATSSAAPGTPADPSAGSGTASMAPLYGAGAGLVAGGALHYFKNKDKEEDEERSSLLGDLAIGGGVGLAGGLGYAALAGKPEAAAKTPAAKTPAAKTPSAAPGASPAVTTAWRPISDKYVADDAFLAEYNKRRGRPASYVTPAANLANIQETLDIDKRMGKPPGWYLQARQPGEKYRGIDRLFERDKFLAEEEALLKGASAEERLYIDIAPDLIKHAQDMRKEDGLYEYESEKEAFASDERLYIDIAPDLIKHAQDMRKEAEGWFYTPTPTTILSPEELLYNKNLAQLITVGGGAALFGGGAALIKALRRPSVERMAGSSGTSSLPMELSVPQRKLVRRRKPEEDEEDRMDKAAEESPYNEAAQLEAGNSWLGSDSAPIVKWPSIVGLGLGGFWGGNALGDYLAQRRRKRLRAEAVRDATEEYEDAIAEQFETSKEASAVGSSLDELYDGFVKLAKSPKLKLPRPPMGGLENVTADDVAKAGKKYLGLLTLAAAISGIPSAMMSYNWTRNKARNKSPLSEAMRRRKAELARRRPQPIYLTPGEAVLHEEKEDEPIVASV